MIDAITAAAGSPLFIVAHAMWFGGWIALNVARMQQQADKRAHLDLQVNLLAEQELTTMLKMLTGMCQRLDVKVVEHDGEVEPLLEHTNIHTIANALDRELGDASTAPSSAPALHTPSPHRS